VARPMRGSRSSAWYAVALLTVDVFLLVCGVVWFIGGVRAGLRASLAVVFECGHAACVFVALDNDARGERRAALVSSFLARLRIIDEEAYLLWVNGGGSFLEASARPRARVRGVLGPASVGGACDACEGFVEAHHGVAPCFQYRGFLSCCVLSVSCSRVVRLRGRGRLCYLFLAPS
jgi:hypothetical protein